MFQSCCTAELRCHFLRQYTSGQLSCSSFASIFYSYLPPPPLPLVLASSGGRRAPPLLRPLRGHVVRDVRGHHPPQVRVFRLPLPGVLPRHEQHHRAVLDLGHVAPLFESRRKHAQQARYYDILEGQKELRRRN